MGRYVTVNLFEVHQGAGTQPLADTLDEFAALALAQRWRDDLRLDRVERAAADGVLRHATFHLDFAKGRPIGPGRMSARQPVADVGLNGGEQFGEETAALYLPHKGWLLALHNQYGVGPSRMAGYFNALDPGSAERHFDYEVRPMIDRQAMARMQAMGGFAQLRVTASVGAFEALDDEVGESVSQAASAARAMRVDLRLAANPAHQRGGHLSKTAATRFINGLLSRSEGVDKIEVKSSDEQMDASDRVIDLIEQKVRWRYPDTQLTVLNHRYTHESKIDLLRRACRGWLDQMG